MINNLEEEIAAIVEMKNNALSTLKEYIVGNDGLMRLVIVSLLAEGHLLIEGVPGTAKTTISKTISLITGCEFKRIQGAMDLQPTDLIGVRIYDQATREFTLREGPVFTNILLADELNRVNPKTQSAFIESMSEKQATIDGITLPLPRPFFVIATQNPSEMEGTFPLIEVQRDRFMFSMKTSHLGPDEELEIIRRAHGGLLSWNSFAAGISPLITKDQLNRWIECIGEVRIEEPILQYIRDIIVATRHHPDVSLGVSSRASIAFVKGVKALAALHGRTYVIPDDVKWIAEAVLLHRLYLTREAEIEGLKPEDIVHDILETVEVK